MDSPALIRRIVLPLVLLLSACDSKPLVEQPVSASVAAPEAVFSPTPVPVPTPEPSAIVGLPAKPGLTEAGRNLIIDFEVGGPRNYDPHPEWPGGASGITAGIGYDFGYSTKSVILSDWKDLDIDSKNRLAAKAGITGAKAQAQLREVIDIIVGWNIAVNVFDAIDMARWWVATKKALPGFDGLRPNAQSALVSLGYNRGWSFVGPNRSEMRAIRDLVPEKDYPAIANQLRQMSRIWRGTPNERGLTRRRYAEAKLLETP